MTTSEHRLFLLLAPPIALGCVVAVGGTAVWLVAAGCVVLLSIGAFLSHSHLRFWQLEIPIALLLASTLVWRIRDAGAISEQPLDPAGLWRVGLLAAAVCIALIAVPLERTLQRVTGPTLLYAGFGAVALAGMTMATAPAFVAFRACELLAATFIIAAAAASDEKRWLTRALTVMIAFTAGSLVVVLAEAVLLPELALRPVSDYGSVSALLPFRVEGVIPHVTPNTVGTYGLFLAILMVYAAETQLLRRSTVLFFSSIGVLAVVASQYRTGYVALVLVGVLLALYRPSYRRPLLIGAIVSIVVIAVGFTGVVTDAAKGLAFRGQTPEVVTSLTGRDQLWREAISVWEESPLVGAGLASATRYDALEGIGRDTASTIHSTWVEALAGTGIFGVVLLASAYVVTFRRALGDHHAIPVIALTAIGVRSITGTSIELVSFQAVMFLIVMQWVSGASSRSVESVESGPVVRSQGDPHPRTLALSENRDRS